MKNEKAELTTTQIVTMVILLISFIVILFLLFRLNISEISDAEICHNSVVLAGNSVPGLNKGLNCKTNYICISAGGECINFNPTTTIKLKSKDVASVKNEVYENIAKEMSQCWWMFGEGKVNYISGNDIHCGICDVVQFDSTIDGLSYSGLYTYLQDNKKDETQSYLMYLYGVNTLDLFKSVSQLNRLDINTEKIDATKKYVIVTGRINPLVGSNKPLNVYLVPNDNLVNTLGCEKFDITQA